MCFMSHPVQINVHDYFNVQMSIIIMELRLNPIVNMTRFVH